MILAMLSYAAGEYTGKYVTGFAKTRHNPARTEIHFIA